MGTKITIFTGKCNPVYPKSYLCDLELFIMIYNHSSENVFSVLGIKCTYVDLYTIGLNERHGAYDDE